MTDTRKMISEIPALFGMVVFMVLIQMLTWQGSTAEPLKKWIGILFPFIAFGIGYAIAYFRGEVGG
jgi:ABC-type enterochelin transport system permease subunit